MVQVVGPLNTLTYISAEGKVLVRSSCDYSNPDIVINHFACRSA